MRFVVIGAAGQLGRDLTPLLPGEVIPVGRPAVDLTQPEGLSALLDEHQPDAVINCAAYNFVDKAEAEPDAAFAVNAWGVRALARECARRDCLLMHFSTDFVFGLDAHRATPYLPTDAPGPVSVYGMSKLTGEYAVRTECPKHFVIRTCGLYGVWGSGGKGTNFVETMLKLAGQGKPLKVVGDQTCTPSFTKDIAAVAVGLLKSDRYGLYHATNTGAVTWHDFARAIFDLAGIKADLSPTTSAAYNAPARRPPYSVLDCTGLTAAGVAAPRDWRTALTEYLSDRNSRSAA
ncbi:MAG: dTDP-4-dehydrorhamnose reductase [Gemmataceae bacterium]|nr:dTDP-4-dehydrorhamnose reductase [Gemmataceae bacterium]